MQLCILPSARERRKSSAHRHEAHPLSVSTRFYGGTRDGGALCWYLLHTVLWHGKACMAELVNWLLTKSESEFLS